MSSLAAPASQPPSNTLYAARCLFSLRGVVIGYATQVSWSENYTMSPIVTLNNLETVQHVPTAYAANLTSNNFRLVGTTLRTLGILPKLGQTAAQHLQNLAQIGEMTGTVEDSLTNAVVAIFAGCRVESWSHSVQAGGNLVMQDVTYTVRRILSEEEG